MIISPRYRDYKSKAAVLKDWDADKDFTVEDFGRDMGRAINKTDAKNAGIKTVNIRYQRMTKVMVVTL